MQLLQQGLRFGSVGVLNTLLGGAVIAAATWFGAIPAVANALGYAVGLACAFALHRGWTFGSRQPVQLQFAGYAAVLVMAWLFNLVVVLSLVHRAGANPYAAQLAGMATYSIVTFVALKQFVFRA